MDAHFNLLGCSFALPHHFVKNLQLSIWIRESQAQTDVQAGAVPNNRVYFTK
jgi:hypothetical protein